MIMLIRSLAAGLAAAAFLMAPALAGTSTVEGGSLVLSDSRSNDTVIHVDPSLHGHIRFTMEGDPGCLSIVGAGAVAVGTSGCGEQTGRLDIDVPAGTPLTISASGSGDLRLADDISAPLVLDLTGAGDVVGGKVAGPLSISVHGNSDVSLGAISGPATLEMTGSGDVRLGSLDGTLTLKHEGNGDLAVGRIAAGTVTIDSTGSGDMLFGRGSIGTLIAHLQGNGDLGVAADVHDGDVRAHGGGDVKLGKVTGTLNRANGDNSDIYVGGSEIIDTIVADVAKQVANSKSNGKSVHSHDSTGAHLLVVLLLGIVAFIAWRILRRPGGISALRGGRSRPAAPTHPGVVALCEKMARMEERLGRVEGYVTSREFDLHQKFRNL
jgi:hypothetical protein